MRIGSLVVVCALVATSAPSIAEEEQQRSSGIYVTPVLSFVQTDDDRAVDDAAAFTFATGFAAHRRWNFEISLFRGRFDGVHGDDLTLETVGINALRVFQREARVAPYLLAGLGAQRSERTMGESSTGAYADAGAGLLTTLRRSERDGRALMLRLDARARYDDAEDGRRLDYLLGLGLQYSFGSGSWQRAPAQAPAALPPASDAAPPAHEDRDGVSDGIDRCSGTQQGRTVDGEGCEIDTDDDGVAGGADDCPATEVGARACADDTAIHLPLVVFEYDSDRLRPEALAKLDEAVETLRKHPHVRVELAGHADDRGSEAYNLALSRQRADAVRQYLNERGVSNVLTVRGHGESEPVADNRTQAGRAENRRVVLQILSH